MPFTVVGWLAWFAAAGCARTDAEPERSRENRLVVFAASSLTEVLRDIGRALERDEGLTIQWSFGSSGTLARQLANGAPADVFLSANAKWVDWLDAQGACTPGTRRVIVGNSLVVVAPGDSSLALNELADLAGLKRLALAQTQSAPAGIYAKEALERSGTWAAVQERTLQGENARATLTLVARGEADAGIVYASDAQASSRVRVVLRVPPELHDPVEYVGVTMESSTNPEGARRVLAYLQGDAARSVFSSFGFEVVR